MELTEDSSAVVAALVEPEKFRAPAREHVFKSEQSLQWFMRRHRDALVKAGALVLLVGRWYVHPARFDAYLMASAAPAPCGRLHADA